MNEPSTPLLVGPPLVTTGWISDTRLFENQPINELVIKREYFKLQKFPPGGHQS